MVLSNLAWLDKKSLSEQNLFLIKKKLTIIPRLSGFEKADEDQKIIYMFQERGDLLGVPREWYRQNNSGTNDEVIEVSQGRPLRPVPPLTLRDYQAPIVDSLERQMLSKPWCGGLLEAYTGFGKCHARGTKVLMFSGEMRSVEDVGSGDLLMGPDSTPRRVLNTVSGRGNMYKITPTKGDPWFCNEDHILNLRVTKAAPVAQDWLAKIGGQSLNMTVKEYLSLPKWCRHRLKQWRVAGVDFDSVDLEIDPYMVGIWLGDGGKHHPTIFNPEPEIRDYIEDWCLRHKSKLTIRAQRGCSSFYVGRDDLGASGIFSEMMCGCLPEGIGGQKRIPNKFLINSRANRLKLLAGLLDTDGYLYENCFEIITKYDGLRDDILFLARSLGLAAYSSDKIGKIKSLGFEGLYYRIKISGDTDMIPCLVQRKRATKRSQIKNVLVTGFSVDPVGVGDYYGFNLDGDQLYLMNDFTVTHNSISSMELCRRLGGTAIVFVHKEPLKDQWIEALKQFCPTWKVGFVQGKKCEYEGKDIVIAMVQSVMKDSGDKYPDEFYRYFRTFIYDETHHASAEAFATVAPKFNAKYMLGVSGTIRRKDGTENVFYWGLGPMLAKATDLGRLKPIVYARETGFQSVRKETVNPATGERRLFDMNAFKKPTQLNFLMRSDHRNDLIAYDVVKSLQAGRNPLVMSERLEMLDKIADRVRLRGREILGREVTTGMYIGEKSKDELRVAGLCEVVFATSQLAKEGIDIPRLDTLFLATGDSDPEQACGRITRSLPDKKQPMVVDYLDSSLDNMKKTFYSRLRLYKRLKWEVIGLKL